MSLLFFCTQMADKQIRENHRPSNKKQPLGIIAKMEEKIDLSEYDTRTNESE